MNVTVTDQEACKKQLRLEIPGETVRAETDKVATELAKQISVPGFRPGHVPKSVVKTRFKKELRDEVLSHLIPHSVGDAIKEKELKVVGQPSVDELKFRDDETIDLTISLEVAPEFELSNYKSMPVRKRVYKIRDIDVDNVVEAMRMNHAQLVPVEDRPAQIGDIVGASLSTRLMDDNEEVAEAGESERKEIRLELGGREVLQEFTDALTGTKIGENKQFTVTYPADYKASQFAGKTYEYNAEVTGILVKELPDLDDQFAQVVNEDFKTMADLRDAARKDLEEKAGHRTEDELRNAVMDQLIERNRFDVPEAAVEEAINARISTLVRGLAAQGVDPQKLQVDWDELREANRDRATKEVRAAFILDRIADTENIEASDEELDNQLNELAENSGQSVDQIRARLTKNGTLDRLREQIRNRKVLDLVISAADIKIEEVEGPGNDESESAGEQDAR